MIAKEGEKMTTISLRFNDSEKIRLDELCSEMGINLTTLFMIYAKKVIRDRKIPFAVEANPDPFYSAENLAHLQRSIEQINSGKVVKTTLKKLEAAL